MDRIKKERRSWNMSRIRGKNTKPELLVRSAIHQRGYRFRLHSNKLPGKPDIVLPKYKTVIFVHGCFWHRHKGCKYAYTPKSRFLFWKNKFTDNIKRFKHVRGKIRRESWRVYVIWECQALKEDKLNKRLDAIFKDK